MGRRGGRAVFMPSRLVFPGGAVDAVDLGADVPLTPLCRARLAVGSDCPPGAVAAAALRELTEETGQTLRHSAPLRFIFRAITPRGATRRYDARFFLADADDLATDPDRFGDADEELTELGWRRIDEAAQQNLPFPTRLALAEAAATPDPAGVPFLQSNEARITRIA
ncbi:NUDIX hydrolase [Pelagovum pacificum]|uniref:NUDIX hydrolase n=2 Tax=Pelagovum pacificum TaxID=2588711 RepID=A0A5C5GKT5_9RHOB|nr:NUDIX hydrolase [Pelagovum pacificum]TNY34349.1 NUDIX hydrolase [Pelagovum pacificum]